MIYLKNFILQETVLCLQLMDILIGIHVTFRRSLVQTWPIYQTRFTNVRFSFCLYYVFTEYDRIYSKNTPSKLYVHVHLHLILSVDPFCFGDNKPRNQTQVFPIWKLFFREKIRYQYQYNIYMSYYIFYVYYHCLHVFKCLRENCYHYCLLYFLCFSATLSSTCYMFTYFLFHRSKDKLLHVRDSPSLGLIIGIVVPIVLLVLAAAFLSLVIGIRRKRKSGKRYRISIFLCYLNLFDYHNNSCVLIMITVNCLYFPINNLITVQKKQTTS